MLGVITIFGFSPYNLSFINFFTFSILLFLIVSYSVYSNDEAYKHYDYDFMLENFKPEKKFAKLFDKIK